MENSGDFAGIHIFFILYDCAYIVHHVRKHAKIPSAMLPPMGIVYG